MPYGNKVLGKYLKDKIPHESISGICKVGKEWDVQKPYINPQTKKPYKVLYNGHIDLIALVLIDTLIRGGAEIHVTATESKGLFVAPGIEDLLKEAKIPFYKEGKIPKEMHVNYFDFVKDCGGGLIGTVTPNIRSDELTHTPPKIYENLKYPVVNVDGGISKLFETFYGTGQAFPDAIKEVLPNDPRYNAEFLTWKSAIETLGAIQNEPKEKVKEKVQAYWFHNKKYVVFGYGKVGTGIANALRKAGVLLENIIVVDMDEIACTRAKFAKYSVYKLDSEKKAIKESIKRELQSAFCVVTATGVEGCISQHFERADFPPNLILANMGTPFEYGAKFKREEVLNNGNPFNFMRETPTDMVFLDAPFELWLRAGDPRLTIEGSGLQPVPKDLDQKVVLAWQKRNPMLCPNLWEVVKDPSFLFSPNSDDSAINSDFSDSCDTSSSDSESESSSTTTLSNSPPGSPKKHSIKESIPLMLLGSGKESKELEDVYTKLSTARKSLFYCGNDLIKSRHEETTKTQEELKNENTNSPNNTLA